MEIYTWVNVKRARNGLGEWWWWAARWVWNNEKCECSSAYLKSVWGLRFAQISFDARSDGAAICYGVYKWMNVVFCILSMYFSGVEYVTVKRQAKYNQYILLVYCMRFSFVSVTPPCITLKFFASFLPFSSIHFSITHKHITPAIQPVSQCVYLCVHKLPWNTLNLQALLSRVGKRP